MSAYMPNLTYTDTDGESSYPRAMVVNPATTDPTQVTDVQTPFTYAEFWGFKSIDRTDPNADTVRMGSPGEYGGDYFLGWPVLPGADVPTVVETPDGRMTYDLRDYWVQIASAGDGVVIVYSL